MKRYASSMLLISMLVSGYSFGNTDSNAQITLTEDEARSVVEMMTAYKRQKELISSLQQTLREMQSASAEAATEILSLRARIVEMGDLNAGLKADAEMLEKHLAEEREANRLKIEAEKKRKWKWGAIAGAGGLIVGIIVGLIGGS